MKTGLKILFYSSFIILANAVLGIRINDIPRLCRGESPFSTECMSLIPWGSWSWVFIILVLFIFSLIIENKFPIKVESKLEEIDTKVQKTSEQLNITTSFIESLGNSVLDKEKTSNDLISEVHKQATKALESGKYKKARDLLDMKNTL